MCVSPNPSPVPVYTLYREYRQTITGFTFDYARAGKALKITKGKFGYLCDKMCSDVSIDISYSEPYISNSETKI